VIPHAVVVPGYRIFDAIGGGTVSTVHRAEQIATSRDVALKLLKAEIASTSLLAEPFLREARLLRGLSHPHVIELYDADCTGAQLYISLERALGGDLAASLKQHGKVAVPRALRLLKELAEALAYLHGRGLVHRDVKPSNVLLTADDHVKLADFGLAATEEDPAGSRAGFGTLAYMAPEELLSAATSGGESADPRGDLYALGATAFEMLSGEKPPGAAATLAVDHPIADLVHALLAKHPLDRPQTATAVVARLAELAR
jgi:serine/threonine-protein kinase